MSKLISLESELRKLQPKLKKDWDQLIETRVLKLTAILEDLLAETLDYSFTSPKGTFSNAIPATELTNSNTLNYTAFQTRTYMSNGGGRAHIIWHKVNRGVDPFQAKKTTIFRPLNNPRTTPGTLKVKPFGGYQKKANGKDRYITVQSGNTINGFPGRNWYEEAWRRFLLSYPTEFIDLKIKLKAISN